MQVLQIYTVTLWVMLEINYLSVAVYALQKLNNRVKEAMNMPLFKIYLKGMGYFFVRFIVNTLGNLTLTFFTFSTVPFF